MLNQEILENIAEINKLLMQIKDYWTKIEITKSNDNKYVEMNISIYLFIQKNDEKQRILAYVLRENINLNEVTANEQIKFVIDKIKELIHATNEKD